MVSQHLKPGSIDYWFESRESARHTFLTFQGSPFCIQLVILAFFVSRHYKTSSAILFQEGWPQNALQLASVLLSASKTISGSASGRGLATPAQFVDQVLKLAFMILHFDARCKCLINPI